MTEISFEVVLLSLPSVLEAGLVFLEWKLALTSEGADLPGSAGDLMDSRVKFKATSDDDGFAN